MIRKQRALFDVLTRVYVTKRSALLCKYQLLQPSSTAHPTCLCVLILHSSKTGEIFLDLEIQACCVALHICREIKRK